ncbi:MAG: hypothetical protein ACK4V1_09465 [Burkholderiaceae bacterium]
MTPLEQRDVGETAGAVASMVIFIAVYAACVPAFGMALTLALGWLPAAVAAVVGAHAIRFVVHLLAAPRTSID